MVQLWFVLRSGYTWGVLRSWGLARWRVFIWIQHLMGVALTRCCLECCFLVLCSTVWAVLLLHHAACFSLQRHVVVGSLPETWHRIVRTAQIWAESLLQMEHALGIKNYRLDTFIILRWKFIRLMPWWSFIWWRDHNQFPQNLVNGNRRRTNESKRLTISIFNCMHILSIFFITWNSIIGISSFVVAILIWNEWIAIVYILWIDDSFLLLNVALGYWLGRRLLEIKDQVIRIHNLDELWFSCVHDLAKIIIFPMARWIFFVV